MFRFTIRDLLWSTVLVSLSTALVLGWKADRARLTSGHQIVIAEDVVRGLNPGDKVVPEVGADGSVGLRVIPAR